jgi:hypothetical protein
MKRSIPTGAWIAGGLVAAAMVVPGVSYAAATLTQIVGTNGTTTANVSKAHQLLTAEATPSAFFTGQTSVSGTSSTVCQSFASPPAGHGAVLARIGLDQGNGEYTLNPGVSVPAGSSIYLQLQNFSGESDDIYVTVDGYSVAASGLR